VRRRLVVLSLATTVLVVVAFVLPLGLLIRRQAVESAQVGAERDAQSVTGLVALSMAVNPDPAAVAAAIGDLPEGTIVVLGDTVVGEADPGQGQLVAAAIAQRSTVTEEVEGGWEIAVPVLGGSEVAVVDSHVTAADLTAGVATAWALLAALAVVLVAVAVWVADRLGRSLTAPIEELARSAHRLADGDLEARVAPAQPEEIEATGRAFNYLAERLDLLLAEERESAADLSHRLRTPLTSLRLQAESLGSPDERAAMLAQVDRLEHAMDQVMDLARSRAVSAPARCDMNRVVAARAEFWKVLADEQGRELAVDLGVVDDEVPLGADDLGVLVDAIVGNVFAHTAPGTALSIVTGGRRAPWLEISDEGTGFGDVDGLTRGVSGSGSTGLGLDIVRKTVTAGGGSLRLDDRPEGGAVVRVVFG
jgi:signal transduction histidine kinase